MRPAIIPRPCALPRRPALRGLSLVLPVVLALAACAASRVQPPPPDPDPFDASPYVIGASDVLSINVWRNPELSVNAVVRPDGKISVPLVDDVHAEGLTALELKEVLTRRLSEYVANPDVTVGVSQINSKRIYFVGDGVRSTAIPLQQRMRVLDAVAVVGGFGPFADKSDVRILRRTGEGGLVEYRFDYDAYLDGNAPDSNIVLQPGDTILVP